VLQTAVVSLLLATSRTLPSDTKKRHRLVPSSYQKLPVQTIRNCLSTPKQRFSSELPQIPYPPCSESALLSEHFQTTCHFHCLLQLQTFKENKLEMRLSSFSLSPSLSLSLSLSLSSSPPPPLSLTVCKDIPSFLCLPPCSFCCGKRRPQRTTIALRGKC